MLVSRFVLILSFFSVCFPGPVDVFPVITPNGSSSSDYPCVYMNSMFTCVLSSSLFLCVMSSNYV